MESKVAIVGGGIIGTATAFYLAEEFRFRNVTVIEAGSCVASQASGKAGGFLAKDWCDGGKSEKLAHKSFELHRKLGERFPDVGYRRLDTFSITANAKASKANKAKNAPNWLDEDHILDVGRIGTKESTAQVHPKLLTSAFAFDGFS